MTPGGSAAPETQPHSENRCSKGEALGYQEHRGSCQDPREYRADHEEGGLPSPTPTCSTSSPPPAGQKRPAAAPAAEQAMGAAPASSCQRPARSVWTAAPIPAAPTQSQASGSADGGQGLSPENRLILTQLLKITTKTQVHFKLCLCCPQSDFLEISKAVGMFSCFVTLLGGGRTCPIFMSSFAGSWDARVTVQFVVCWAP